LSAIIGRMPNRRKLRHLALLMMVRLGLNLKYISLSSLP
jgi:hypothetical protein